MKSNPRASLINFMFNLYRPLVEFHRYNRTGDSLSLPSHFNVRIDGTFVQMRNALRCDNAHYLARSLLLHLRRDALQTRIVKHSIAMENRSWQKTQCFKE